MEIALCIKSIRQDCLMSQQAFAEEIGVSFSTVNRWEKSRTIPNYSAMKRIVDYCKTHEIDCSKLETLWKENK